MKKHANSLIEALGLEEKEQVAAVGGGGKTSLIFDLAQELHSIGRRVVTSTTTKVWRREAGRSPAVIYATPDSAWQEKLRAEIRKHGHVFVGRCDLESGKVQGISPETADALFQDLVVDYLILEADGAAGLPVKAPAQHEPVIPSSATLVVALMGLEAVGKQLEGEVVFRPRIFERMTGLVQGGRLTPEVLARFFASSHGLFRRSPSRARQVVFLNKLDLLEEEHKAWELADLILQNSKSRIDRVVVGSIVKGRYAIITE